MHNCGSKESWHVKEYFDPFALSLFYVGKNERVFSTKDTSLKLERTVPRSDFIECTILFVA